MPVPVHFGMIDHSAENSGTLVYFEDILSDGSNWMDFQIGDGMKLSLVKSAIVTLTKLNMTRTTASVTLDTSSGAIPSAADAQREWAIRFTYVDEVSGKKYSFSVPAPVDAVVPSGTDVVNLDNVLIAAFVTVFEAQLVSPEGNSIEIIGARLIGRNS